MRRGVRCLVGTRVDTQVVEQREPCGQPPAGAARRIKHEGDGAERVVQRVEEGDAVCVARQQHVARARVHARRAAHVGWLPLKSPPAPRVPAGNAAEVGELRVETAVLSSRGQGSSFYFEALMARHGYGLHAGATSYGFPAMLRGGEDVLTRLEGVGRASHAWLLDGGWHHVAMRKRANPANASECFADIWIDGQSPAGFNSTGPAQPLNSTYRTCSFNTGENRTLLPTALGGDIDEVAVWSTALSDTHIAAHAAGALNRGEPYTFTDPGGAPPPVEPTDGPFDLKEHSIV